MVWKLGFEKAGFKSLQPHISHVMLGKSLSVFEFQFLVCIICVTEL